MYLSRIKAALSAAYQHAFKAGWVEAEKHYGLSMRVTAADKKARDREALHFAEQEVAE